MILELNKYVGGYGANKETKRIGIYAKDIISIEETDMDRAHKSYCV